MVDKSEHVDKAASAVTTELDDQELLSAGYKRVMPRRFTTWTLLALSFDVTVTWLGVSTSLGVAIPEGSSAGVIWSVMIAGFFTAVLALGMAELASAYPVAGGQYFWSFMVSNEAWAPFASFAAGYMAIFGWWLTLAAECSLSSGLLLAMAQFNNPSFVPKPWHQYLIYVAVVWLTVACNTLGAKFIPVWNRFIMCLNILVILAMFLTVLACSRQHYASAKWIFTDTTNSTGWSSTGFAFMLAVMNSVFSFVGIDAGAHMAEEIPSPSKNVPKAIVWPVLIGTLTAWPLGVALMAGISDLSAVLGTPTGQPLVEVLYQGTGGSAVAATILTAFATASGILGGCVGTTTVSSRMLWAASRDGALPLSRFWAEIHPVFQVPANAMLLTATVVTLYGLIFLGSNEVFSSMISASVLFIQSGIAIPQAILLFRGRSKSLPPRYFRIPEPFGYLVNAVAVAWTLYTNVMACMPVSRPVTLQNMNWVSVISVGLLALTLGVWIVKRKTFRGPQVDVQTMKFRREQALGLVHEGDDHVAVETKGR